MKKFNRKLKAFFVSLMKARRDSVIQRAKSNFYNWD